MDEKKHEELPDQDEKPWSADRCLFTSITFAALTSYMLLAEKTFGRSGGFTPQDDPFMYWGCIVIFGGISVYLFAIYIERRSREKN